MALYGGIFSLVLFAFWAWAIYSVITTPAEGVRNLPKVAWVFVVLLFSAVGAFAWVALGRPHAPPVTGAPPKRWQPATDDRVRTLETERERIDRERREYYARMDEELDRRLAEKRPTEPPDEP